MKHLSVSASGEGHEGTAALLACMMMVMLERHGGTASITLEELSKSNSSGLGWQEAEDGKSVDVFLVPKGGGEA